MRGGVDANGWRPCIGGGVWRASYFGGGVWRSRAVPQKLPASLCLPAFVIMPPHPPRKKIRPPRPHSSTQNRQALAQSATTQCSRDSLTSPPGSGRSKRRDPGLHLTLSTALRAVWPLPTSRLPTWTPASAASHRVRDNRWPLAADDEPVPCSRSGPMDSRAAPPG
jgi:hypothetical protein